MATPSRVRRSRTSRVGRALVCATVLAAFAGASSRAVRAQSVAAGAPSAPAAPSASSTSVTIDPNAPGADLPPVDIAGSVPPPPRLTYLQYGVAFTAEMAVGGAFCEDPQLNCILGSGGGIAGRVGWRGNGPWYFGGAYELSKQDPTKLYVLAILQQLRFEARRHWLHGKDTQPVLALAAGLAAYGNEWAISTWGPTAFLGGGIEFQVQNGPVLGLTIGYRPIFLRTFSDTSGRVHTQGFAHMFGLELALEAREPL